MKTDDDDDDDEFVPRRRDRVEHRVSSLSVCWGFPPAAWGRSRLWKRFQSPKVVALGLDDKKKKARWVWLKGLESIRRIQREEKERKTCGFKACCNFHRGSLFTRLMRRLTDWLTASQQQPSKHTLTSPTRAKMLPWSRSRRLWGKEFSDLWGVHADKLTENQAGHFLHKD